MDEVIVFDDKGATTKDADAEIVNGIVSTQVKEAGALCVCVCARARLYVRISLCAYFSVCVFYVRFPCVRVFFCACIFLCVDFSVRVFLFVC